MYVQHTYITYVCISCGNKMGLSTNNSTVFVSCTEKKLSIGLQFWHASVVNSVED